MNNYTMTRGWMKHPLLDKNESYSRREVWIWLIENAIWRDTRVEIEGRLVPLRRGQLSFSIRFLAKAWRWNPSKVERFIKKLRTETMIDTQTDTGRLVITICNYDKYQLTPKHSETKNKTSNGTTAGQPRDINGTKKNTLKIPANTKHNTLAKVDAEIASKLAAGGLTNSEIDNWFGSAEFDQGRHNIIFETQFKRDYVANHFDGNLRRAFGFIPDLHVTKPPTAQHKDVVVVQSPN